MGEYEIDEESIPTYMKRTSVERHKAGSVSVLSCNGCGHEWANRVEQPGKCPNCQAKLKWDESVEEQTGDDREDESEENEFDKLFGGN